MTDTEKKPDEVIVSYERQILHYIIKSTDYIEEIFQNQNIPIENFTDKNIK